MFNNIGKKIKTLAVVLCILGMVGSLVGSVLIWTQSDGYEELILLGFAVLLIGCLLSWLCSFFAYGFGQLIEKTEENNYHLNQIGHMLYEMKNQK